MTIRTRRIERMKEKVGRKGRSVEGNKAGLGISSALLEMLAVLS